MTAEVKVGGVARASTRGPLFERPSPGLSINEAFKIPLKSLSTVGLSAAQSLPPSLKTPRLLGQRRADLRATYFVRPALKEVVDWNPGGGNFALRRQHLVER